MLAMILWVLPVYSNNWLQHNNCRVSMQPHCSNCRESNSYKGSILLSWQPHQLLVLWAMQCQLQAQDMLRLPLQLLQLDSWEHPHPCQATSWPRLRLSWLLSSHKANLGQQLELLQSMSAQLDLQLGQLSMLRLLQLLLASTMLLS